MIRETTGEPQKTLSFVGLRGLDMRQNGHDRVKSLASKKKIAQLRPHLPEKKAVVLFQLNKRKARLAWMDQTCTFEP
jgi:hypothetical protein